MNALHTPPVPTDKYTARCPRCHQLSRVTSTHCAFCGTKMPMAPEAPRGWWRLLWHWLQVAGAACWYVIMRGVAVARGVKTQGQGRSQARTPARPARPSTGRVQSTVPREVSASDATPTGGFQLVVEQVFAISGKGTVVTGTVACGRIRTHDTVVVSARGQTKKSRVVSLESYRKPIPEATVGVEVGMMLANITTADAPPGATVSRK